MPRYTHIVVSSEEPDSLELAQQLWRTIPGVRTEAHCQSASEAELILLYSRDSESPLVYAVLELKTPSSIDRTSARWRYTFCDALCLPTLIPS
jgi:hypothetical protein